MYTQCPECGSAFRVTAEVLRQAAGKVRCGGCGHAFNSLDYLSEQRPGSPAPLPDDGPAGSAPEPPRLEADELPETASGEYGADLLQTLDELADPDIRVEDTGIEWRVFGPPEEEDVVQAAEDDEAGVAADDGESTHWFMDESPTPVDEQLSDEPGNIDEAEIFETTGTSESVGEMRFDDNTPLPDDFDFESEPPEPVAAPEAEAPGEPAAADVARIDLAFGEPEDWEDLLGEVDETEDEYFAESDETVRVPPEEAEARRAGPLPDVDTQFAAQAEAMGIDLSGMHARREQAEEQAAEEPTLDDDLIAAAFETEARSREEDTGTGEPAATAGGDAEIPDENEQYAEPVHIAAARDDADEYGEMAGDAEIPGENEEFAEPEHIAAARDDADEYGETAGDGEFPDENEEFVEPEHIAAARDDADEYGEFGDFEIEAPDDLLEARDRELAGSTEGDARLATELGLYDADQPDERATAYDRPEQVVPPLTEEEQTINMMIDQELLAIAVEDEDGFASTIVQKQRPERDGPADVREREGSGAGAAAEDGENEGPLVETIIMEGEFVRDAFEEERLEAERRRSEEAQAGAAPDTGGAGQDKQEQPAAKTPVNYRMAAGIAGLALLLGMQFIHHSRNSLAVYPTFNNSVGPFYRMLGKPLVPAWDIAGWRFEATKGSTDDSDEVLTIYSRIGNQSGDALPYPLINVSLTDRFEDVIGSKVLEPGDYLAENLDTRKPVAPGETFSAVISIEAPDVNATGFKLNVCYPQPGGRLRCAIDDFK